MPVPVPAKLQYDQLSDSLDQLVDYRTHGQTGLKQFSGLIHETIVPELRGQNGLRVYRKMWDTDPVCGGIMCAIDKLVRQIDWTVKPASHSLEDQAAAEHLESCLDDMEHPLKEYVCEMMSMVPFGFSLHEICYKRRGGDSLAPWLSSKYADGRVGWRGLPGRAQETIRRWNFNDHGMLESYDQWAPPCYRDVRIPMGKSLLMRTSTLKDNPQGRSALVQAYRAWYMREGLEVIEAVGAERDLAGVPCAYVPVEVMAQMTPEAKRMYQSILSLVDNIRLNEQASIVMPQAYDSKGNKLYDLQLLNSGGAKQFDVDKIIQRYDHRIAMSMLADFMLMGQSSSSTGSFAMHSDKRSLFAMSLVAYLDIIADQFNNHAIPRLMRLNAFDVSQYPRLEHGDIEDVDLAKMGAYLQALSGAGMPLFPNPALEKWLCEVAGIPVPVTAELPPEILGAGRVTPPNPKPDAVTELHDEAATTPPDTEPHPDGAAPAQAAVTKRNPGYPRAQLRAH